jgi:pyridoxine 5-phosphate synthase
VLAQELGLGVNAGHDLDLGNLSRFLGIDGILEVSIGHALTVESIEKGMGEVIGKYLDICNQARI